MGVTICYDSFWCPNIAGMQPFSHLPTMTEMCRITSILHNPNRWFGTGEPVPWPTRSPDLTHLDYFLWGSMKNMVYYTSVTSEEDLIAQAHGAIESLTRQLIGHVRETQHRRCKRLCNDVGGTQFEPGCNVDSSMCWTCSVYWHVALRCSTAPKSCVSGQGFRLEK